MVGGVKGQTRQVKALGASCLTDKIDFCQFGLTDFFCFHILNKRLSEDVECSK
jgi:hypothetical protein